MITKREIVSRQRRFRAYKRINHIIDEIINDWCAIPNGYAVWLSIPERERTRLREVWAHYVITYLLDQPMTDAVVKACLQNDGKTSEYTTQLYHWAIEVLFNGREPRLYKRWFDVMKMHNAAKAEGRPIRYERRTKAHTTAQGAYSIRRQQHRLQTLSQSSQAESTV